MLNNEEINLYDRQIRIWGHDVQKRIKKCSILMIGFSGLAWETAKNLILYGIKTLHILDDKLVTESDLNTNLYLTENDIGLHRAEYSLPSLKLLNPNVIVTCDTNPIENYLDRNIYENFDIIILNDVDFYQAKMIDQFLNKAFLGQKICVYGRNFYLHGIILYDFGQLTFPEPGATEKDQTNESNTDSGDFKANNSLEYPTFDSIVFGRLGFQQIMKLRKSDNVKRTYHFLTSILKLESEESELLKESFKVDDKSSPETLERLNQIFRAECQSQSLDPQSDTLDFCSYPLSSFSPSCAILAGFLCQELIRILSNSLPNGNILLYDGANFEVNAFNLLSNEN